MGLKTGLLQARQVLRMYDGLHSILQAIGPRVYLYISPLIIFFACKLIDRFHHKILLFCCRRNSALA